MTRACSFKHQSNYTDWEEVTMDVGDMANNIKLGHTTGSYDIPEFTTHRYKKGDYVKFRDAYGFIIGKIIKLDEVELGNRNYESYTMKILACKTKMRYANEFSFGGGCVEDSEKISEVTALTLGL